MRFAYHCVDSQGKFYDGVIHEDSLEAARHKLESNGWQVLRLELPEARKESRRKRRRSASARQAAAPSQRASRQVSEFAVPSLPRKQLRTFTAQLAAMLAAGVPLLVSLEALGDYGEGETEWVVKRLHKLLLEGHQLSAAMSKLPDAFDPGYVTVVRASEESGKLQDGFHSLCRRLEREELIRNRLWQAMAYPAVVTLVSLSMLAFLLYYMFPRFAEMFTQSGAELPWITRMVMAVSSHSLPVIVGGTLLLQLAFMWTREPKHGVSRVKGFLLFETPWVGTINRAIGLAELGRDISISLDSGIPIGEALSFAAAQPRGDFRLREALKSVHQDVISGAELSDAMARHGVFPPLMVTGAKVGLETGTLPEWFSKAAENLELEVSLKIEALSDLLEPVILGVLGLGVGVVVLAAFLPIYQMVSINL